MTLPAIRYETGHALNLDQVTDLYASCSLGARRPVANRERMQQMLQNANLVVTAWDEELLVGIARALSDFSYATYLSDLAVRETHQKQGIGKELIREVQRLGGQAKIILLSAPEADAYYPALGFVQRPQAWMLGPEQEL